MKDEVKSFSTFTRGSFILHLSCSAFIISFRLRTSVVTSCR